MAFLSDKNNKLTEENSNILCKIFTVYMKIVNKNIEIVKVIRE